MFKKSKTTKQEVKQNFIYFYLNTSILFNLVQHPFPLSTKQYRFSQGVE